jgi:demethylmenaquinone methyltransferase/2-methoxy-6-polyprenyl-1,4-benzoquinol methylase
MSTTTAPSAGSGAMFDAIAQRYDLLNRIISFGADKRWRSRTVAAIGDADRVLDVATGTGDLAIAIAGARPHAHVVGVDPSTRMLEVGRAKVAKLGLSDRVELREGDAQALPFEDASFDAATIAFGIRNVPDRIKGLAEMARVTRPGGRVVVLELSEPREGVVAPFARFHVHKVVPAIGAWLSGAREYRYLAQSIEAFPPAEEFARMMTSAGLEVLEIVPMTFGACTLYVSARRAA